MMREHPNWQSVTGELKASELRPGCTIRYEPPKVAGRGYAALLLDKVEHAPEGTVRVEWCQSRLDVVLSDTASNLVPWVPDDYEPVELPDSLSFHSEDTVVVEIRPPAYA